MDKKARFIILLSIFPLLSFFLIILLPKSLVQVPAEAIGVVLRSGNYARELSPGQHFILPIVEEVYKVPVKKIIKSEFGFSTRKLPSTQYGNYKHSEFLYPLGDHKILNVEWVVQYQITDPKAFLFYVKQPSELLDMLSMSIVSKLFANTDFEGAMITERFEIEKKAQHLLQQKLDEYGTGIQIRALKLQNVLPPKTVKPTFDSIVKVHAEVQKMIKEAKQKVYMRK
ncbi:MAG: SPFH domain-containing protein [bacterium]|nr:hypothetical protein [bacterium]